MSASPRRCPLPATTTPRVTLPQTAGPIADAVGQVRDVTPQPAERARRFPPPGSQEVQRVVFLKLGREVRKGRREITQGGTPTGRIRRPGAGRPRLEQRQPGLLAALEGLVDPLPLSGGPTRGIRPR